MYYLEDLTDVNKHYEKMKEEEKERQKKENKSRSILIIVIIPLLLLLYIYLDARCDYVLDQCIEEYGKNYCIEKLK